MQSVCSGLVILVPLGGYGAFCFYVALQMMRNSASPQNPTGWDQLKPESYNSIGRRWLHRLPWILAGFVPLALLLVQVSRGVCHDWP
jgi:hypothetical protein